jgi:prepilin-type N-terminal cleavage/methylation domain-containing protein
MRKGYTLLEVLVSVVIISSSIIAIFQIFSLGFRNLSKLYTYQDLYIALTNLMEEIDLINDFEKNKVKNGKIGNFDYDWQASPYSPKQRMIGFAQEPGPFDIILYKIVLKIYFETQSGKKEYKEFTFFKVGWVRAQE